MKNSHISISLATEIRHFKNLVIMFHQFWY